MVAAHYQRGGPRGACDAPILVALARLSRGRLVIAVERTRASANAGWIRHGHIQAGTPVGLEADTDFWRTKIPGEQTLAIHPAILATMRWRATNPIQEHSHAWDF